MGNIFAKNTESEQQILAAEKLRHEEEMRKLDEEMERTSQNISQVNAVRQESYNKANLDLERRQMEREQRDQDLSNQKEQERKNNEETHQREMELYDQRIVAAEEKNQQLMAETRASMEVDHQNFLDTKAHIENTHQMEANMVKSIAGATIYLYKEMGYLKHPPENRSVHLHELEAAPPCQQMDNNNTQPDEIKVEQIPMETSSRPKIQDIPTIRPAEGFSAEADAEALRAAMKGLGTNEKEIIQILCHRSCHQRLQIASKYQQMHGRVLVDDLKEELAGKFETVILALMSPIQQYLAQELRDAMKGAGTDERTIIEILATQNNAQIRQIKHEYLLLFGRSLEDDLKSETSGDFGHMIMALANGDRDESADIDSNNITQLKLQLYAAGEAKRGTDEQTFIHILCNESWQTLQAVFAGCEDQTGKPFEDTIKKELSGDFKMGMKAIYNVVQNKYAFFASELHSSMAGLGTRDRQLIRLVVARSEIDLGNIKQEYSILFKNDLEADIKNDVSGDYRRALLAVVQE